MSHFYSIDYLRALAAFGVVVFHAGLFGSDWSFVLGNAGVDIFFVVSGLVMVISSQHLGPRAFLLRRLVRIVPLYWLVTLVTFAVDGLDGSHLPEVLRSLAFIPYVSPESQPLVAPIVSVGWTLNLEMMFYLLFTVAMILVRAWMVPVLSVFLLGCAVAGKLLPASGELVAFYTQGIILEFAFGLVLGQALLSNRLALPPWIGVLCATIGGLLLAAPISVPLRVLEYGVPAALLVTGAVIAEPWVRRAPLRVLKLCGDASYSLYLWHLLILSAVFGGAAQLGVSEAWPLQESAIVIAQGVAVGLYLLVEKPIHQSLRRLRHRQ